MSPGNNSKDTVRIGCSYTVRSQAGWVKRNPGGLIRVLKVGNHAQSRKQYLKEGKSRSTGENTYALSTYMYVEQACGDKIHKITSQIIRSVRLLNVENSVDKPLQAVVKRYLI